SENNSFLGYRLNHSAILSCEIEDYKDDVDCYTYAL
ncbi:hypothetical protein KIPB_009351, partial [Kipferlia bialata]